MLQKVFPRAMTSVFSPFYPRGQDVISLLKNIWDSLHLGPINQVKGLDILVEGTGIIC